MAQSHAKNKNAAKSIGNTRSSNDYTNGRLPLPPVQTSKTDYIAEGMIVSSMTVPPQKLITMSARKSSNVSEHKSKFSSSSDMLNGKTAEEWERLLKEKDKTIRDKEKEIKDKNSSIKAKGQEISKLTLETDSLQSRIAALEKECSSLKKAVSKKEEEIVKLQAQIDAKKNEKDYKALYEAELVAHKRTTNHLTLVKGKLDEKVKELQESEKVHSEKLNNLQKHMEEKMKAAIQTKDDLLREKYEIITKMKKQMADAFTGSSVERQQQIDELSKELSKMQTECDNLKMKLRQGGLKGQAQSSSACESCKNLKAHLEKKEQVIKERNRTVDELTLIVGRYETQLKQQEELLKEWQDVKGRVLIFDK